MNTTLDWEWAQRSSGNLSPRQKLHLTRMIVTEAPSAIVGAVRYRLGRYGGARAELGAFPDSRLARQAVDQAREDLSPHLLEHAYRSYFFGKALAGAAGVGVDDELVFVSCLLHDLTLETPTPGQCSAYVSGMRAAELVQLWGAAPDRAQAVGAAVCGHISPHAGLDDPAGFVLAGSSADVVGRGLERLDPAWVAQVLSRYPRRGLNKKVIGAMQAEAAAVPDGRVRHGDRMAKISLMIKLSPFTE
ncbi:phosphohydrolase [Nocardia sp. CA-128927]|uniref:phosphohydrolase n=1 Tax=Nocardia sp. CA-128927 TaxID=3239975 RepID=UPI003D9510E3